MTLDEAIKHAENVALNSENGLYDAIALGGQNPSQEEIAQCEKCAEEHRQLAAWLKELKRFQWISVEDGLPENSGCVLISIAGDIEFGAYDRQNSDWAIWRDGYWDEGKRADAWMPLPEPYREDGEE